MKVTYYAAISTDGFIAGPDGDVSWLDELEIDAADTGYDTFFASVDGLVMGRNTYDFVYNYGLWPYGAKPTWIATGRKLNSMEGAVLRQSECPATIVRQARQMGLQHLWLVGGGKLASSFLQQELLTDLSLSQMPVELGDGIPLFSDRDWTTVHGRSSQVEERRGFRQIEVSL